MGGFTRNGGRGKPQENRHRSPGTGRHERLHKSSLLSARHHTPSKHALLLKPAKTRIYIPRLLVGTQRTKNRLRWARARVVAFSRSNPNEIGIDTTLSHSLYTISRPHGQEHPLLFGKDDSAHTSKTTCTFFLWPTRGSGAVHTYYSFLPPGSGPKARSKQATTTPKTEPDDRAALDSFKPPPLPTCTTSFTICVLAPSRVLSVSASACFFSPAFRCFFSCPPSCLLLSA